jgi:pimeloyl-ACP methyl ester carboxylesterase
MVGHTYGGLYALSYAWQYPAEVVGLVLLHSSHPDQFTSTP